MEEKKLTDEEIIRGIKNWILHDCTAKVEDLINALDLIRRLQGKVAEYERKLADGEVCSMDYHEEQMGVLNCEIEEYKAEIERLTKLVDKWENAYGSEYWLAKHNEMLKEILQEVDKESNGQTVSVTNVLRKRYNV